MARDHTKLQVFVLADALAIAVYRLRFPAIERFGLQSQIRRAAVSVTANLVEGCARRSEREYVHFVDIALGSATEARYLLDLAARLGIVAGASNLSGDYGHVVRALEGLLRALAGPVV